MSDQIVYSSFDTDAEGWSAEGPFEFVPHYGCTGRIFPNSRLRGASRGTGFLRAFEAAPGAGVEFVLPPSFYAEGLVPRLPDAFLGFSLRPSSTGELVVQLDLETALGDFQLESSSGLNFPENRWGATGVWLQAAVAGIGELSWNQVVRQIDRMTLRLNGAERYDLDAVAMHAETA